MFSCTCKARGQTGSEGSEHSQRWCSHCPAASLILTPDALLLGVVGEGRESRSGGLHGLINVRICEEAVRFWRPPVSLVLPGSLLWPRSLSFISVACTSIVSITRQLLPCHASWTSAWMRGLHFHMVIVNLCILLGKITVEVSCIICMPPLPSGTELCCSTFPFILALWFDNQSCLLQNL